MKKENTTPDAHASDNELALRAAAGDREAFAELYRRHHDKVVYAICLRMTGNPAEAEDRAHDVFIHLLDKIGTFRGESQFKTWLHRMTVNQVLMHFRKKSTRCELLTDEGEMPEFPAERPAVVDRVILDRAIAQLPPRYRQTFILHDVEGHEHEEVARIMGCTAGTSKSQLHKARMKLRKSLGPVAV